MTIYHFCDDSFGAPFAPVSAAFAKAHGVQVVLVRSVRPEALSWRSVYRAVRRPVGRAVRRVRRMLTGAPAHPEDLPSLRVTNVNAPHFCRLIKDGDVGVVTGFNQIFSAPTILRFRPLVNLHPSILPLYRGPNPSYWCLRNAEAITGFTLHKVTPKIDAGEVLYQDIVPVEDENDVPGLDRKIARAALPTFQHYLRHLAFGDQWVPRYVDAFAVYRIHLRYASFPTVKGRGEAPEWSKDAGGHAASSSAAAARAKNATAGEP